MLLYKIVETAISVGIETATPISNSTVPHEMRFVFVTQTQIIPVGIVDRRISGHWVEAGMSGYQANLKWKKIVQLKVRFDNQLFSQLERQWGDDQGIRQLDELSLPDLYAFLHR